MRIPNPYRGLRGLPSDVWIIAVTTLVHRAGMMALPFLVLYLTRYLRIAASLAGLVISTYGVGGLLTAPIAGRLADRLGPFAVLRASLASSGVILLIIPLAHNFAAILVLTFLWAVVADAARPATMSALTGCTPSDRRKAAIALNRLAINLGMSIGPAVGGFLALVSFPLLFVVDGVTSLTAAALLSGLLWARGRSVGLTPDRSVQASTRAALFSARSAVCCDRAALLFFASSFLMNVVFSQQQAAMPLYLVRDLHYRESFYGGLYVLNTLIIVMLEIPLNVAMARWSGRQATALATLLVAVGFGSLGVTHDPVPIALTVVVWTFGEMIFFPTATAYVAELAPAARTGEYMGALSSTFSLALAVGPWLGVALLDRFGALLMWSVMLICGFAAAALGGWRWQTRTSASARNSRPGPER